jgi:uncharacterized protein YqhQ
VSDETLYGGQAVIEGVMMRSPTHFATAVRTPGGEIVVQKDCVHSLGSRWRPLRWPFLRGTAVLIDALVLGVRALNFSANAAIEEQNPPEAQAGGDGPASAHDNASAKPAVPAALTAFSIALGLGLGIVLFVVLPVLLTKWLKTVVGTGDFASTVLLGAVKMAFFLGYVLAVSQIRYIKRLFQYHAAEHMVIHAFEANEQLTVENVQRHCPRHRRCGSSFVALVILVSIAVFAFVGWSNVLRRLALEIILLPVIAGISYELLRASGRRQGSWLLRVVSEPGTWFQALTTRLPTPDQIEVAIRAFNEVRGADATGGQLAVGAATP